MSRNYELIRKAEDAIHAHREPALSTRSRPSHALPTENGTAPTESRELDFDFLRAWQVIVRRRAAIYVCTAAMFAAAGLVCLFMTPQYKAESKLELLKQDTSGLSLSPDGTTSNANSDPLDFNVTMQTQLGVLNSDVIAWQVMKELKLVNSREADHNNNKGSGNSAVSQSIDNSPTLLDKESARALKQFKSKLNVKAIPGTRLISVSYMHRDPNMAAKIVNQLVSNFIEYNFQVRYTATAKATDWLRSQLVDLKSQVEKSQQRAAELQRESGILGEDEHHNIVLARLEQLNNEVTTAEAERVNKETVYMLSRSGNPELIAGMLGRQPEGNMPEAANPASLLNQFRQQEATLSAEYADASAKYGQAYPRLIQTKEKLNAVRSSIAEELGKIASRAREEYQLAASREAAARKEFTEQKAIATQMNDKASDYLIAKHEAESGRVLYEHLLEKLKEASVLAGLHSNALHILDPAKVPSLPARPNVPLYLGLGTLSGLFLGVVSAFVLEATDRTVRNVGEIETITYVPILGVVPDATLVRGARLKLLLKAGKSETQNVGTKDSLVLSLRNPVIAEAFRAVRTSLLLSRLDQSSKILMITSGTPQEGKSFVSLNLAASFASNGARVLLVDADLRRGTLSKVLKQRAGPGLSDLLRAAPESDIHPAPQTSLEDATLSIPYRQLEDLPRVTFMPAGTFSPYASELLGSQKMNELIESWRTQFDYVLIDTPPAVPVTDAVILSRQVDAVVVVARFAVTNQSSLQRTIRLLRDVQATRLGVLVNGMDIHSPEFYHYSGFYGGY